MSVANARRASGLCQSAGEPGQERRIDADVIQQFADAVNPQLLYTASDTQQALDTLGHRREQLVKQRAMEKQLTRP